MQHSLNAHLAEEETTTTGIVETLRMIGDYKVALLILDRELAGRAAS